MRHGRSGVSSSPKLMQRFRRMGRREPCPALQSYVIMLLAVLGARKDSSMARGWIRRKQGKGTLFCYYNSDGRERSKVIGPGTLSDREAWIRIGDLGLDKLVAKSDPTLLSFGELAEKYLANYPFNKQSTKQLHEQIVRRVLMSRWSNEPAIKIDPPKLKAWLVGL